MYKLKGINLKTYRSTKDLQRQKRRSRATEPPVKKKTLTQPERKLLESKLQESRDENIKKSFVGKANPVYLAIIAIGLIFFFFAYIAWIVSRSS